jgi:hypothetical protein
MKYYYIYFGQFFYISYWIQEPTVRARRAQQLTTVSIKDAHCSLVPCKNLPRVTGNPLRGYPRKTTHSAI